MGKIGKSGGLSVFSVPYIIIGALLLFWVKLSLCCDVPDTLFLLLTCSVSSTSDSSKWFAYERFELKTFLLDGRFLLGFVKNDFKVEENDLFSTRGEDITEEVFEDMND